MSYALPRLGVHFSGLGEAMTVNLRTGDDRVRALQRELARLGFLSADPTREGVDGKWGANTEAALRAAAQYVGFVATPFTRSGSQVTVPDGLLVLLRVAPPRSAPTPTASPPPGETTVTAGGMSVTRRPDGSMTLGPLPDAPPEPEPIVQRPWLLWAIGGFGVMAIGVGVSMMMAGAKQIEEDRFATRPTLLATNARRRRRRRAYRRRRI